MSDFPDLDDEMKYPQLDPQTTDRILDGSVSPDDAPAGYEAVAALIKAASAVSPEQELPGESVTVAAMAQQILSVASTAPDGSERRESKVKRIFRVKIAAISTAAVLVATTGLAFAGALPDAAQDAAAKVLDKVGITIPNSNSDDSGKPEDAGSKAKSDEVRQIIESTEPGLERGREVSDEASEGKSRVPESVPANDGDNSGGQPEVTGTARADEASGGRSGGHTP